MLGGEPFPKIIDEAIKTRTFRLVALLPRHSPQKPSPRKERALALNLGREWEIDFMIPLNVDGLKPSQLLWDYSELTYIVFEDWAAGLDQLLRALAKAGAPRLGNVGSVLVAIECFSPWIINGCGEALTLAAASWPARPVGVGLGDGPGPGEKKRRPNVSAEVVAEHELPYLPGLRPPTGLALETHVQYNRKPARCQPTTVLGATKIKMPFPSGPQPS
jgi:hypothetical protein